MQDLDTADVPRPAPRRRPWADVGALAVLGAVLVWLPALSGGRTAAGVAGLGLITVVAVPAAYHGLTGTSRTERLLLSLLGAALLLHPFVAPYRDQVDGAMLRYATVPLVYLTSRYVAERWPRLLPAAIPIAGLWIWAQGWPGWLDPPETVFAAWRVVPWHNPSGILLGALSVYALTVLLAGHHRWLHAAIASLTLSGLWLTASRASIVMTAGVVVVILAQRLRDRQQLVWLGGVAAAAVVVAAALLAVSPAYGSGGEAVVERSPETAAGVGDPFDARGDARSNARARLLHVEAAIDMFAAEPLTGVGLGSYGHQILTFAPPDMNYTRSAHNEPAEVLGEGGLIVGVPFLLLVLAAGVALARRAFRRDHGAYVSGAAFGAGLILGHTWFDVDWFYLVVVGVAGIATGLALTARGPQPLVPVSALGRAATVTLLVVPVLLGAGLTFQRSAAASANRAGWWEADPHLERAADALAADRIDVAGREVAAARAAAPGGLEVSAAAEILLMAGARSREDLFSLATDPSTSLHHVRFAIAALVGIDRGLAEEAVQRLQPRLDTYHAERVERLGEELGRLLEPVS